MEMVKSAVNMETVNKVEKHGNGKKRGKTWKRCKTQESTLSVKRAGKHGNGEKRGEACEWCKAQEKKMDAFIRPD